MPPEPALADPESDPTATWALDPGRVRRLAALAAASPGAPTRRITVPFTGAPLAQLPTSTAADVVTAVARARAEQPGWAARAVRDRAAVLLRVHDLVLSRQSEALDLIQLEAGKARGHAFEEVADVAINARWYARHGPSILADRHRAGLVPGLTQVTRVLHAKGVVGVIAPWNYPLTLAVSDALPALLAGNAVLLKPDPATSLCALWIAELLTDAGLPPGMFQVVLGPGDPVGTALVEACDHVCFTGSTATGRLVGQRAGARLVGTSLELGGKNALYVADDADLDRAAEAAVRDCFASAGQLCVSIERLLLHERIADAFIDRFTDRVGRLRLGADLDFTADLGCLVSPVQLARVQQHLADALAHGARVLVGGHPRPDIGPLFFEPTVLDRVPPAATCYAQETFGPLVAVHRVTGDEQAVALANDTEYGLNAAVWTGDPRRGRALARRLRAGTVSVNETYAVTWGSVAAPMGGRAASGLGRRHGAEGLLRFTEPQTVAVQRGVGLAPLYALGGRRTAAVLSGALRVARAARLPWP